MKSTAVVTVSFAVSLVLLAGGAGAGVTVTFTAPEKYVDMPYNLHDKKTVMEGLRKHFDKLGATLPAGQDLKVEILDIDLAGRIEPAAPPPYDDVRILRGRADWPAITLRYSLESQGKVLKGGEERIADMTYLEGYNHYNSGEYLRYEKQMLDRWFRKTLVATKAES